MNGGDYVLDAIAEMEMPPAFPKNEGRHPFLVSIDHSKGQLPLIVDTEMLLREGMPFLGYDICLICMSADCLLFLFLKKVEIPDLEDLPVQKDHIPKD